MNHFPDELEFKDAGILRGSRRFKLTAPFAYRSSRGVITVPAGFITDGASIPRIFWPFLDPFGKYFKAAVIHDFLYSPWNIRFNRAESDRLFKEAMFNSGLDWPTRETIYRAVRMFGGRNFRAMPE